MGVQLRDCSHRESPSRSECDIQAMLSKPPADPLMKLLPLILVIVVSKTIFLLSLMEVKERSEASESRVAALEALAAGLSGSVPLAEAEQRRLELEIEAHGLGPQIIPLNLSVGAYMLIIPTSFWIFITSIRLAVKNVRRGRSGSSALDQAQ